MSDKKNVETTDMAVTSGYAALANTDALGDAAEDLAGLQLTFDRIKIPAGGSTAFEIPGDNDETELVKDVKGVILLHHPAYAFYRRSIRAGQTRRTAVRSTASRVPETRAGFAQAARITSSAAARGRQRHARTAG